MNPYLDLTRELDAGALREQIVERPDDGSALTAVDPCWKGPPPPRDRFV